ncbi:MAG: guanylate kinase [Lachnospiraceae bacterium]|nr:guanylate kinase [Lachnospiraceae bacterium]
MRRKGIIIVVSGFSGAGKGTLMKKLTEVYDTYALSVSMTTRAPRPGEQEGRDYFYVSREEFERRIGRDGFVEHAEYCGNYYGTPRDYVERQLEAGRDVILEIEIQGALEIKKKFPTALLLFVMPPSAAELKKRLIGRGTETEEVIDRRLRRAVEEAQGIEEYEYIIINDDLDTCVKEMHSLIQGAHDTPFRNKEFIGEIRSQLEELTKGEK